MFVLLLGLLACAAAAPQNFDELHRQFYSGNNLAPSPNNYTKIENKYEISIGLPGFAKKDIIVRGQGNKLIIQAFRKPNDDKNNYVNMLTLPPYLKAYSGTWYYSKNVLKIVLKDSPTTTETPAIDRIREELNVVMITKDEHVGNADTGADKPRGDRSNKQTENVTEATVVLSETEEEIVKLMRYLLKKFNEYLQKQQ